MLYRIFVVVAAAVAKCNISSFCFFFIRNSVEFHKRCAKVFFSNCQDHSLSLKVTWQILVMMFCFFFFFVRIVLCAFHLFSHLSFCVSLYVLFYVCLSVCLSVCYLFCLFDILVWLSISYKRNQHDSRNGTTYLQRYKVL